MAVVLPDALRRTLAALPATLHTGDADVKWVEPQNLHLTLKFLGDAEDSRLAALTEALRAAVRPHLPFTITIQGIGAFPNAQHPRIIWVGIAEGAPALIALAASVDRACAKLGFPKDVRPFAPHLTIGRLRQAEAAAPRPSGQRVRSSRGPASLAESLKTADYRGGPPIPVGHVTLFQSTLSPHGPTYTPLAELPSG